MNNRLRRIAANGTVITLAGSSTASSIDGVGTGATMYQPQACTADPSGNVYFSDQNGQRVRTLYPNGSVVTLAGTGANQVLNGPFSTATFYNPRGIAYVNGVLYESDSDSGNTIRSLDLTSRTVSSLAGGQGARVAGYADAVGTAATFKTPQGMAAYNGVLYVVDYYNQLIRAVDLTTTVVTTLAGVRPSYTLGGPDIQSKRINDVGTMATFNQPFDVAVDASGNLIIADYANNAIRRVDAVTSAVTTLAGGGGGSVSGSTDGGACTSVAHKRAGCIYFVCQRWRFAVRSSLTRR
jgi:hypothetical protein